jgi:hypothetical protein
LGLQKAQLPFSSRHFKSYELRSTNTTMATGICSSTRASLLKAITAHTSAAMRGSMCAITLPIRTLDGRFVEVFVEPKLGDFFLVHDAGKTVGELHVQGIHWTDARKALLPTMAHRFGVNLDNRGVFQIACKHEDVSQAILAVSQCAAVGMFEAAGHAPAIEEAPVSSQVKRVLVKWKPDFLDVRVNVKIRGANGADHLFDSVMHHKDAKHRTVAVKTLPFGYGARVQADRYGFMVLDIKGTEYDKWRRLAVVSQVDRWPMASLKLVRKFSAGTLEVRSNEEHFTDSQLIHEVSSLSLKRQTA